MYAELTNLPAFDERPLETLHIKTDNSQSGEKNDGLDTGLLALIVFRLGSPVEEGDNVLRHLGSSSRGT